MKYSSMLLWIFLIFCVIIFTSNAEEISPETIKKVKPSVAIVYAYDGSSNDPVSQGSGFFVDVRDNQSYMITNFHVLKSILGTEGHIEIDANMGGYGLYSTKLIVSEDISHDLICIAVDIPEGSAAPPTLQVNNSMPSEGESYCSWYA